MKVSVVPPPETACRGHRTLIINDADGNKLGFLDIQLLYATAETREERDARSQALIDHITRLINES